MWFHMSSSPTHPSVAVIRWFAGGGMSLLPIHGNMWLFLIQESMMGFLGGTLVYWRLPCLGCLEHSRCDCCKHPWLMIWGVFCRLHLHIASYTLLIGLLILPMLGCPQDFSTWLTLKIEFLIHWLVIIPQGFSIAGEVSPSATLPRAGHLVAKLPPRRPTLFSAAAFFQAELLARQSERWDRLVNRPGTWWQKFMCVWKFGMCISQCMLLNKKNDP